MLHFSKKLSVILKFSSRNLCHNSPLYGSSILAINSSKVSPKEKTSLFSLILEFLSKWNNSLEIYLASPSIISF